jgi:hypothetical protein
MHVAIDNALNSIDRTHYPYLGFIPTPAGTSPEATVSAAAHRTLVALFPARQAIYDVALADSLAPPPPALTSKEHAANVNEVKAFGARKSAVRTSEQTRIARFWSHDRNGTFKPPGHYTYITQVVAEQAGLSLHEKARLFALVNLAMADAGITAGHTTWLTDVDLRRPVTAIRLADTDGNPATEPDTEWLPLNEFTPGHRAYTSGHANFLGAAAEILKLYFRPDHVAFTITTDDPAYDGPPRTFSTFTETQEENKLSRIYLGVHFRTSVVEGDRVRRRVARRVFGKFLRSRRLIDINNDRVVNARDAADFLETVPRDQAAADLDHDGRITKQDAAIFVDLWRRR